jgi:hypothetical protein
MASASWSIARNGASEGGGPIAVTEGVAAPTAANTLELRVDLAAGWTKNEIEIALDRITRFFLDINNSTSVTL